MKISRKWLQQLVDLTDVKDEEIASRLTMLGIEVESFENLAERYKGFVVGNIVEVAKHPNADKLTLCKVDIGGRSRVLSAVHQTSRRVKRRRSD